MYSGYSANEKKTPFYLYSYHECMSLGGSPSKRDEVYRWRESSKLWGFCQFLFPRKGNPSLSFAENVTYHEAQLTPNDIATNMRSDLYFMASVRLLDDK